ncbi:hypothetical protein [Chryseobacterium bernardetii]|uniref:hypothetical protein n=1 Tax=Chryseobacterium bernardetii TaxID=1241978 RepID=UPI000F511DAF|nr:hypothetical protein [Chryseobacterium bernardetii]
MKKKLSLLGLLSFCSLAFSQVGINTQNPQGIFNVDGGKNNAATGVPTAAQQTDDFAVRADGSVGIGTTLPDPSAMLDITSVSKGLLAPRVALISNTDNTTIPSPATGLLVFNTGTAALTYVGYVFWNGTEWRTFSGSSLAPGTIGAILCDQVALTPDNYANGTPYNGTMSVAYTGGNGGIYPAQTITSTGVTGLTATLSAGSFAVGSGTVTYTVSGTPNATSPNIAHFALNIGGQTCDAQVGGGLSQGQARYWYGQMPGNVGSGGSNAATSVAANYLSNYQTSTNQVPIIDGIRFDYYAITPTGTYGSISGIPRMVNVSGSNIMVTWSAFSSLQNYNEANIYLANGQFINLDDGIYDGVGLNSTTSSTPSSLWTTRGDVIEIETVDVWVNNHWYRATYFPVVDNNNKTTLTDDIRKVAISVQRLK